MIPAGPHPLLMCGDGDPLDEFGKIERSVRTRLSAGGHFSFTPVATGNRKTMTIGGAVLRGSLGSVQQFFGSSNGAGTVRAFLRFAAANAIYMQLDASTGSLTTAALYRDTAAWVPWHLQIDTPQATASNRFILTIDGKAITSGTFNYPGLNADTDFNIGGQPFTISGAMPYTSEYFDGSHAYYYVVDGKSLPPAAFWAFHPRTGQWRPKSKAAIRAAVAVGGGARNGWGANGSFLPFDDNTSPTTLGYDRSQSDTDTTGNNWTANNISLTPGATCDSMLGTPTRNSCTLNPLANGLGVAPTNGALEISPGANTNGIHGTQIVPRDRKVYWEVENGSNNHSTCAAGSGVARSHISPSTNHELGAAGIAGFFSSNVTYVKHDDGSYSVVSQPNSLAGDVIQVAINGNNGWVGRNDVWFDSAGGTTGNPETGANPSFTLSSSYEYVPYVDAYSNTAKANFGQRGWSRTCPAGFEGINTKLLKYPKIPRVSSAFVALADTGANIAAALDAATSGWPAWIRAYKLLGVEGWRWVFSDDPTNYLDSSGTAAKAAMPALAGSYGAYALRVGAGLVSTGTFAHVNGVPSVINDGQSTTRKMLWLRRESAGGGNWFVYHPDCASGKLLYLNLTNGETTDNSINTVTAGSFTADASLPSGTYRWASLPEIEGFLGFGKYRANGTTDNAFANKGIAPTAGLIKNMGAATNWALHDTARNPYNPATAALHPNTTGGNDIGNSSLDLNSNGFEVRAVDGSVGTNGVDYAYTVFGQSFRYANAR